MKATDMPNRTSIKRGIAMSEGRGMRAKTRLSAAVVGSLMLGIVGCWPAHVLADTITRTTSWSYDAFGQLATETVEPDGDINRLRKLTTQIRDPDTGLETVQRVQYRDPQTGQDVSIDVLTLGYDARKRFAVTSTNAKGHIRRSEYDEGSGLPRSLTGPNGELSTWEYDAWGRVTRETSVDGTSVTTAYRGCVQDCVPGAPTVRIRQHWAAGVQIRSPEEEALDVLQRSVRSKHWGFDGRIVQADKEFDQRGNLAYSSAARFSTDSPIWIATLYDDLGRPTEVRRPSSTGGTDIEFVAYDGTRTVRTDSRNQRRIETVNGLGKLRSVVDADGFRTSYSYDGFGNTLQVVDARGNQVRQLYDVLGRRSQSQDPDLGTWTYQVNPLGQVYAKTDAKNQTTTSTFDVLGRLTRRWSTDFDHFWGYDNNVLNAGLGRVTSASSRTGSGGTDHQRMFVYDTKGRTIREEIVMAGWIYAIDRNFDAYGRNSETVHRRKNVLFPRGTQGPYNKVVRTYNAFGYESGVQYVTEGGAGGPLRTILSRDAQGRATEVLLGNGVKVRAAFNRYTGELENIQAGADGAPPLQYDQYDYDGEGNLTLRSFLTAAGDRVSEVFSYDVLNRMAAAQVIGQPGKTFVYDAIGNIVSRTEVGNYVYPNSGPGSVRPHAVSSISTSQQLAGASNPGFLYDANGNMTDGLGRHVEWNSANQAVRVDRNEGGVPTQRSNFIFGTDNLRGRQDSFNFSAGAATLSRSLIYGGNIEREIDYLAATTTIRTYIGSGLGYLEERFSGTAIDPSSSGTRLPRFFLNDRLGSAVAVLDQSGAVLQRLQYDPWGRRRGADGTEESNGALATLKNQLDRTGYTGQESLDEVGLVHMNGRIYDPVTGRMMSPDPTVPDAGDPQHLNRYAYVLNNPHAYTDPSGYAGARYDERMDVVVIEGVCQPCRAQMEALYRAVTLAGSKVAWQVDAKMAPWRMVANNPSMKTFLLAVTMSTPAMQMQLPTDIAVLAEPVKEAESKPKAKPEEENKNVPNPNGRNGGEAHQEEVRKAESELIERYARDPNIEVRTEVMVRTPEGDKSKRFIDVAAVDKRTGDVVEGVQVGRETKAGNAVAREQRALNDIAEAKPNSNVSFRPYNRGP